MPWIRGRFYVDFAALREAEIDRARQLWTQNGQYMGRGVQSASDYFTNRIFQLNEEIKWLVAAALRATNNRARQRLFRKAHFVRLEKKAVEAAQRKAYIWQMLHSSDNSLYSAPPPE